MKKALLTMLLIALAASAFAGIDLGLSVGYSQISNKYEVYQASGVEDSQEYLKTDGLSLDAHFAFPIKNAATLEIGARYVLALDNVVAGKPVSIDRAADYFDSFMFRVGSGYAMNAGEGLDVEMQFGLELSASCFLKGGLNTSSKAFIALDAYALMRGEYPLAKNLKLTCTVDFAYAIMGDLIAFNGTEWTVATVAEGLAAEFSSTAVNASMGICLEL
jgi:hypothetical protein